MKVWACFVFIDGGMFNLPKLYNSRDDVYDDLVDLILSSVKLNSAKIASMYMYITKDKCKPIVDFRCGKLWINKTHAKSNMMKVQQVFASAGVKFGFKIAPFEVPMPAPAAPAPATPPATPPPVPVKKSKKRKNHDPVDSKIAKTQKVEEVH